MMVALRGIISNISNDFASPGSSGCPDVCRGDTPRVGSTEPDWTVFDYAVSGMRSAELAAWVGCERGPVDRSRRRPDVAVRARMSRYRPPSCSARCTTTSGSPATGSRRTASRASARRATVISGSARVRAWRASTACSSSALTAPPSPTSGTFSCRACWSPPMAVSGLARLAAGCHACMTETCRPSPCRTASRVTRSWRSARIGNSACGSRRAADSFGMTATRSRGPRARRSARRWSCHCSRARRERSGQARSSMVCSASIRLA